MGRDDQRIDKVTSLLAARGLDGLLCRLGPNVLLLSGYQPILGNSWVLINREGRAVLVVPRSELDVAQESWISEILDYEADTLARLEDPEPAAKPLIRESATRLGIASARIGVELSYSMVPASYSMFGAVSPALISLYHEALDAAKIVDASSLLEELGAVKTPCEIERIRLAYRLCQAGYETAKQVIEAGVTETAVAGAVSSAVQARAGATPGVRRALVFAHVMSGPRSALAYRPYNTSTGRVIEVGNPVLVQLEVCADGYWAEMTRTFMAGQPSAQYQELYQLCSMAQQQALLAIAAGAQAATVDKVARDHIAQRGYGRYFLHGLGHGVGFQPISHRGRPRLHPASPDILEAGMIHNVEPAVYMEGFGGIRINDTVLDLDHGAEYLSETDRSIAWTIAF